MPASIRNPRRHQVESGEATLPTVIRAVDTNDEKKILHALYDQLNSEYSVGLVPPNLCRCTGVSGSETGKGRVIFIGASNTAKMVEHGDNAAVHVLPKWRPAQDIANLLAARMAEMNITDSDTVIVDLLSNSSFMGSDEDGMPARAAKINGTYHFTGNMEGAPTAILKKAIGLAGPILRVAGQAGRIIFLVPLPRYAEAKCCQDPGHISNFGEPDYSDTIRAGIENCTRLLNQEAAKLPNSTVVDLTDAFIKQENGLYSSMGTPIWSDPVHLTRAAYADIWASLQRFTAAGSGKAGAVNNELRYTPIINNRVDRRMPGTSGATPGWLTGTATGNTSWRPGGNKAAGRRGHFRYNPY